MISFRIPLVYPKFSNRYINWMRFRKNNNCILEKIMIYLKTISTFSKTSLNI